MCVNRLLWCNYYMLTFCLWNILYDMDSEHVHNNILEVAYWLDNILVI